MPYDSAKLINLHSFCSKYYLSFLIRGGLGFNPMKIGAGKVAASRYEAGYEPLDLDGVTF